jgi:hypothetical protein
MPINRIPRKLFDYRLKGSRRRKKGRIQPPQKWTDQFVYTEDRNKSKGIKRAVDYDNVTVADF